MLLLLLRGLVTANLHAQGRGVFPKAIPSMEKISREPCPPADRQGQAYGCFRRQPNSLGASSPISLSPIVPSFCLPSFVPCVFLSLFIFSPFFVAPVVLSPIIISFCCFPFSLHLVFLHLASLHLASHPLVAQHFVPIIVFSSCPPSSLRLVSLHFASHHSFCALSYLLASSPTANSSWLCAGFRIILSPIVPFLVSLSFVSHHACSCHPCIPNYRKLLRWISGSRASVQQLSSSSFCFPSSLHLVFHRSRPIFPSCCLPASCFYFYFPIHLNLIISFRFLIMLLTIIPSFRLSSCCLAWFCFPISSCLLSFASLLIGFPVLFILYLMNPSFCTPSSCRCHCFLTMFWEWPIFFPLVASVGLQSCVNICKYNPYPLLMVRVRNC